MAAGTKTNTQSFAELRKGLEARYQELEPLAQECAQIKQTLDAMEGQKVRKRPAAATAPRSPRGNRIKQFEGLITKHPGLTVTEAATKLKMQPNYLYRIARDLTEKGSIAKGADGGYVPVK